MPRHYRRKRNDLFSLSLLLFLFLSLTASAQNVSLSFPAFSLRNFTLLGDSHLRSDGALGLTRELGVPSSSAGSAVFNDPIRFFDPESNSTASFESRFSFSVVNANPGSASGDGLAFFLSPDPRPLGSPGGYLGLVNASKLTKNKFLAVEFDTRMDLHFNDPNDNHVGFDIDCLVSVKTADPMAGGQGIDLKSGIAVTAWIEYENAREKVRVFMSYSTVRPENPILTVDVGLFGYLKEEMYVGFSASTEGSTELHLIENWSFRTYGLPRPRVPHNVSDSSVNVTPVIPEKIPGKKSRREKLGLGFGIAGPGLCFFALVVFSYFSVRRYNVRFRSRSRSSLVLKQEILASPREFTFKELKSATRGFHSSRILGNGAFGTVYKAFLEGGGSVAAVKRSKHSHELGKSEFLSELSIIACLRHKNLVQLQGWCVEKGELLLVYDFMPNGSLDKALYNIGPTATSVLTWHRRHNIAIGLASALTYLHRECEQQVIHRDVKTGNVLLDAQFNPRLGDFGLAKLTDHDKSPVSTLTAGTMGYLAPEYLQYGKATEMTDVFSFGVVILELACGRRPIEKEESNNDKTVNLVDWVWNLHSQGNVVGAADPRLGGDFDRDEMRRLLLVGLGCANPDSAARPSMRRALQMLSGEAEVAPVPKCKPSLSFSCSLAYSLSDIVSDEEEKEEKEEEDQNEIKASSSQE